MESLDELSKINSGKPGFFKHVFNFDEESKADMLNIVQYSILALIPIVILNKIMQRFVPEADDEKKTIEIFSEVLAQVIFMFLGIFFIHRILTYIPTYSGEKYPTWNSIGPIIPMLVIITSLQTKLGEKVSILVDRIVELWEGPKDTKGKKGNGSVKVSQPISQNQSAMNQSLNSMGSTSISSLPSPQSTMTQQLPNYDQMYQQDSTPLVGASTPGMETFEPQAANGGFGAFGSAFGGNW
jgi:hypothetical protein